MAHYKLAFLGFGNVGKSFARLLLSKQTELHNLYALTYSITGIATASHGMAVDLDGIDLLRALKANEYQDFCKTTPPTSVEEWIDACEADVLFETTPVNYTTGQPAANYLRAALERGMHAITANKGPVVHAYQELKQIAASQGRYFLFESTVLDGAPIFSLFQRALPAAQLISFQGILNSTTNLILTKMGQGDEFNQAVKYCQNIGIAETDPSGDIDGWDAAVKVAALVTVLMGIPIKPSEVQRQGIRDITGQQVLQAAQEGKRWKLICSGEKQGKSVHAKVQPELVGVESLFYNIMGTSSLIQFRTDVLGQFSIIETDPGPDTTAYGLLSDFIYAVL